LHDRAQPERHERAIPLSEARKRAVRESTCDVEEVADDRKRPWPGRETVSHVGNQLEDIGREEHEQKRARAH
jgi:hypothetical protein